MKSVLISSLVADMKLQGFYLCLEKKSLNVTVVSMPCWEIFDKNNDNYKNKILGPIKKRIAIPTIIKIIVIILFFI